MSSSSFIQSFSSLLSYSDHLISKLVYRVLPDSNPSGIEFQILKSYFAIVLFLSTLVTFIKFIQLSFPSLFFTNPPTTHLHPPGFSLDHQRSTVDIYIDFNHFDHNSTHHSISYLLLQFKSIVHHSLQNSHFSYTKPLKLVYWSYIDRHRSELSDWISQLDQLESQFEHGFVQVIDTSQNSLHPSNSPARKPLLNDLLNILHVSPPGRIYVLSTSDPHIYGAGIQLIKNHPNSPVVAYIPPCGSSLESTESIPSVDYLFSWNNDSTVKLMKVFTTRQKPDSSPTRPQCASQKFEPLNLFFAAYSLSGVPLETLQKYLEPWCSKLNESKVNLDGQVAKYIDSAIDNRIISISEESLPDQPNSTRLVVYPAKSSRPSHLQLRYAPSDVTLSFSPPEKAGLDEDSLTNTGSETSSRSRSAQSSPLKAPAELPGANPTYPPAAKKVEQQDEILKPLLASPENHLKHKYNSLDLIDIPDRPIKKNKNQEGDTQSLSSSIVRSGSKSFKKKVLIKNKNINTEAVVSSSTDSIQPDSLVKRKPLDQHRLPQATRNPEAHVDARVQPCAGTALSCNGIFGLKSVNDELTCEKPGRIEENDPTGENNVDEGHAVSSHKKSGSSRLGLSTVWLNCSSGIIMNSLSTDHGSEPHRFQGPLSSRTCNRGESQMLRFRLNIITLSGSNFDHDQQEGDQLTKGENMVVGDQPNSDMFLTHLHFKSFFIPAFLKLDPSSAPPSPMILNLNLHIEAKQDNHQTSSITPLDLSEVD